MKVIVNNNEIVLEIADNFFKKLSGFMFQKKITKAIRFKTNSIHTFFMKTNIDVVMTTKDNKILYIYKNLPKNKIIIHRNVYYTYEFPSNFINNLKVHDTLKIKE